MKIIGISGGGYIAEVTHTEIEKVFDKYYGNLKRLNAGDVVNLSEGYDFREDIRSACSKMIEAYTRFGSVQNTLLKFSLMVCDKTADKEETPVPAAPVQMEADLGEMVTNTLERER